MTDAAMLAPHTVTRTITESIAYPAHDPRTASKEYERVHHHLVYELDEPCWICGIRQSQLPAGEHMETHHARVEWALVNRIDPALILADFPEMGVADEPHLREWLDSEGNMLVLCAAHHRHGLVGIHMITFPAWTAQRWLQNGEHDISKMTAFKGAMKMKINLATLIAVVSGLAGIAGSIITPIYGTALAGAIQGILQAVSGLLVIIAGGAATSVVHTAAKAKVTG